MGPRPTQGDEKSLRPATTLYRTVALSFVIPSEAEGSAVPRTFRGHVFRQSAAERRDLCVDASSWKCFSTERSRGTCGSTELSWKCFWVEATLRLHLDQPRAKLDHLISSRQSKPTGPGRYISAQ